MSPATEPSTATWLNLYNLVVSRKSLETQKLERVTESAINSVRQALGVYASNSLVSEGNQKVIQAVLEAVGSGLNLVLVIGTMPGVPAKDAAGYETDRYGAQYSSIGYVPKLTTVEDNTTIGNVPQGIENVVDVINALRGNAKDEAIVGYEGDVNEGAVYAGVVVRSNKEGIVLGRVDKPSYSFANGVT
jgi:hypothetical protein